MLHLKYYTETLNTYYYIKELISNVNNVKQLDSIKIIVDNSVNNINSKLRNLYNDLEKHWWSIKRFKWYRRYNSFAETVIEYIYKSLKDKQCEFSKNKVIKIKGFNTCNVNGG